MTKFRTKTEISLESVETWNMGSTRSDLRLPFVSWMEISDVLVFEQLENFEPCSRSFRLHMKSYFNLSLFMDKKWTWCEFHCEIPIRFTGFQKLLNYVQNYYIFVDKALPNCMYLKRESFDNLKYGIKAVINLQWIR